MGKPTGFLEYERTNSSVRWNQRNESRTLKNFISSFQREEQQRAGGTLYGLRRTVLPVRYDDRRHDIRLSAAQPRSGME